MTTKKDIEQIIDDEFGSHYLSDELPVWNEGNIEKLVSRMTADSAERVLYWIEQSQIEDMVNALTNLRNKRNQPLLNRIINGTLRGWDCTEEDWRYFQIIVDGIIANLKNRID
ncbi:MAG: hypothetical protein J2P21_00535 [Chloracidobacterium sp.]|nr:hypothetical protein [Chloracidobacterium sp.]